MGKTSENFDVYGEYPKKNIFKIMREKNITLKKLADKAHISLNTLNSYYYGVTDISLSNYIALLKALEIKRIKLYEDKN